MLKPHTTRRFLQLALAVIVSLAVAQAAVADTIYLKNGRSIRSSHVRVEGDRVIFLQYGGEVALPMSMVDRIVEDTEIGPERTTAPPPPPAGTDPPADPAADPDADTPPELTREYWQERVIAITAERAEVELSIEDLRRTERAFLFSNRSTAETRAQITAAQTRLEELDTEMSDLQTEARRMSIPAGWLRVPDAGGGSGGTSGGSSGSGPGGSGG